MLSPFIRMHKIFVDIVITCVQGYGFNEDAFEVCAYLMACWSPDSTVNMFLHASAGFARHKRGVDKLQVGSVLRIRCRFEHAIRNCLRILLDDA